MALKYGVENLGGTKSQLADAILDAMRKYKETSKQNTQERPKETMSAEKQKAEKPVQVGKNGVMAKVAAANGKAAEFRKAGLNIREEGIREMSKGVREFHSATDKISRDMKSHSHKVMLDSQQMRKEGLQRFNAGQAQFRRDLDAHIKENRDSAAKFNSGAGEIRLATKRMCRDFHKAGQNIRLDGFTNLQNGLNQFRSDVDAQIKENQQAVSKINSAARELQGRATSFRDEIHRYQEQELRNYLRDFYYG